MSKFWLVPYRVTVRGTAEIEAETKEAAEAVIENGAFDNDPGEERVDWGLDGKTKESR